MPDAEKAIAIGEIRCFAINPLSKAGTAYYDHLAQNGWAECHGQELDVNVYAAAYAVLETTWGTTSAAKPPNTFLLPHLSNRFLRGRDTDRTLVGRYYADTVRNVTARAYIDGEPNPRHLHDSTRQIMGGTNAGSAVEFEGYGGDPKEIRIELSGRNVSYETAPLHCGVVYCIYLGQPVRPQDR